MGAVEVHRQVRRRSGSEEGEEGRLVPQSWALVAAAAEEALMVHRYLALVEVEEEHQRHLEQVEAPGQVYRVCCLYCPWLKVAVVAPWYQTKWMQDVWLTQRLVDLLRCRCHHPCQILRQTIRPLPDGALIEHQYM